MSLRLRVLSSGCGDATRVNLEQTKLNLVRRSDRHANNVQLIYDAEHHKIPANPRGLHVTHAGGFGFLLDTRGRVGFLAFRDVELHCILDGFAYRLTLPVHVGARF